MLELGSLCLQCRVGKMNKCTKEEKKERWSFSINVQISIMNIMPNEHNSNDIQDVLATMRSMV